MQENLLFENGNKSTGSVLFGVHDFLMLNPSSVIFAITLLSTLYEAHPVDLLFVGCVCDLMEVKGVAADLNI